MDGEPPTLRSRRTLSLRFNLPISRTHAFWDALGEGRFVTSRCRDCGWVGFPPQADCPSCMGGSVEWVALGTDAELITYTQVRVTPTSFVESDPYIVGIGRLERGVKVLAWVEGATLDGLSPGAKVRLEARRDPSGAPYYAFVPVT